MFKKRQIILGIDPGLAATGFGVIIKDKDNLSVINYGVIGTKPRLKFAERLEKIHKELTKIIKKYRPDIIAIEELFFAKNVKTALMVGQARGVLMLTAMRRGVEIREHTPLQVKQALTGYGRADKKQIQQMVKVLLKLNKIPKPDDAADALAVAICCVNSL